MSDGTIRYRLQGTTVRNVTTKLGLSPYNVKQADKRGPCPYYITEKELP